MHNLYNFARQLADLYGGSQQPAVLRVPFACFWELPQIKDCLFRETAAVKLASRYFNMVKMSRWQLGSVIIPLYMCPK